MGGKHTTWPGCACPSCVAKDAYTALRELKKQKSDAILRDGKPVEIALMELRIAAMEIERGEHMNALVNLESARRFIWKIKDPMPSAIEKGIVKLTPDSILRHFFYRCRHARFTGEPHDGVCPLPSGKYCIVEYPLDKPACFGEEPAPAAPKLKHPEWNGYDDRKAGNDPVCTNPECGHPKSEHQNEKACTHHGRIGDSESPEEVMWCECKQFVAKKAEDDPACECGHPKSRHSVDAYSVDFCLDCRPAPDQHAFKAKKEGE